MYIFGKVDYYNNSISTGAYDENHDGNCGISAALEISEMRNLSCVKYYMRKILTKLTSENIIFRFE